MDLNKYRKVIVSTSPQFYGSSQTVLENGVNDGSICIQHTLPGAWNYVTMKVSPGLKYYNKRGHLTALCYYRNNHPLVDSHHAYWVDNNTLVLGYILINNKKIFRPIFQYDREKLFKNVKEWINHNAKFQVAHRRNYLYKKILMDTKKNFPEDMINEILSWTYDPDLLM